MDVVLGGILDRTRTFQGDSTIVWCQIAPLDSDQKIRERGCTLLANGNTIKMDTIEEWLCAGRRAIFMWPHALGMRFPCDSHVSACSFHVIPMCRHATPMRFSYFRHFLNQDFDHLLLISHYLKTMFTMAHSKNTSVSHDVPWLK